MMMIIYILLHAQKILQSSEKTYQINPSLRITAKTRAKIVQYENQVRKSFQMTRPDMLHNYPAIENAKRLTYNCLLNEIEILNYLHQQYHPNIVKIIDFRINKHKQYAAYVMDYYKSDLFTLIEHPNDNLDIYLKIVYQVLSALHHLATKGIAHRDIKPENIFLDDQNNAILGDFGFATSADTVNTVPGTKTYASPEVQYCATLKDPQNCAYNPRLSDLYSFGVSLFYLFNFESKMTTFMEKIVVKCMNLTQEEYDILQQKIQLNHQEKKDTVAALVTLLIQCKPENRPSAGNLMQLPIFQQYRAT
eukprot:NODE_853_length_3537_cov_0.511053.p1 type:complete len:306 gc:universal NODE_853_length_3537_cov_0.511053:2360-3277(+)